MSRLIIPIVAFLLLAILIVPGASADFVGQTGTITIEHIGEDRIVVGRDIPVLGTSTVSPNLVIKILGPGLPADGVSPVDLAGTPGKGVSVTAGSDSKWSYVWRTSGVQGGVLSTARYTIRAADATYPGIYADTSVFITKPDMAITVNPSTISPMEFVTIAGHITGGSSTARVDVIPLTGTQAGTIVRTYQTGVDVNNRFETGVRMDLPPGQYEVRVTNPADGNSVSTTLTATGSGATTATPTATSTATPGSPTVTMTAATPAPTAPSPAGTTVAATVPAAPAPQSTLTGLQSWLLPTAGAVVLFLLGFAAGALWGWNREKSK
jgi:hypothetical protein